MALIYSYKNTPNSSTSIDFFRVFWRTVEKAERTPDHVVYDQITIDWWQKKTVDVGFFFFKAFFLSIRNAASDIKFF